MLSENATPSSFWRLKLERLKCRFPVGISHHKRRKKALTVIVKYHVQLQVNHSEAKRRFAILGFPSGEQMCRKHK